MTSIRCFALLLLMAVVCRMPSLSAQTPLTGNWNGTLNVGGVPLHLLLHMTEAPGPALTATLDSIDQHASGIPIAAVTLTGNQLKLELPALHASYTGTVNPTAHRIEGTWTQGQTLPLVFERSGSASEVEGRWVGVLDLGTASLRLIFQITSTADGLVAQMQSPVQSPEWIPTSSVQKNGEKLHIEIPQISAVFDGSYSASPKTITGTFLQAGHPLPLLLKPTEAAPILALKRPQTPVKPYPYREEEVRYAGKAGTLAGTLTLPAGKGPFPAVLLIAGSGPHGRDEALNGHKPFMVLADALTRRGIAVLRTDKRGIGASAGDYVNATSADFADDAEAGFLYLQQRPEVDAHRTGLLGHSEGGLIAPMVAARVPQVAFVILLGGPGVPGDQLLLEQSALIAKASGAPQAAIDKSTALSRQAFALFRQEQDPHALDEKLRVLLLTSEDSKTAEKQIHALQTPWMRMFLSYDPATALAHLHCPVLALTGSLDLQVPPAQNLPAIRKALAAAGNHQAEIDEMPGLNHLLQSAKTGLPAEYGQIEETMAPTVLDKIGSWILHP